MISKLGVASIITAVVSLLSANLLEGRMAGLLGEIIWPYAYGTAIACGLILIIKDMYETK